MNQQSWFLPRGIVNLGLCWNVGKGCSSFICNYPNLKTSKIPPEGECISKPRSIRQWRMIRYYKIYQATKRHREVWMHGPKWMKPLWEVCSLWDPKHVTFWKSHNHRVSKNITVAQGRGREEWKGKAQRNFRAVSTFCMTPQWRIHVTDVPSQNACHQLHSGAGCC
jgi:hypothetical protein